MGRRFKNVHHNWSFCCFAHICFLSQQVPLFQWKNPASHPPCRVPCPSIYTSILFLFITFMAARSEPRRVLPLKHRLWGMFHQLLVPISQKYCSWTRTSMEAPGIWPLPFNLVLKWSDGTREEEVSATNFAGSLGIPVPRILCYGEHERGPGSFLMTRMPGKILGEIFDDLEEPEKERIQAELKSYLKIMREASSPWGDRICSVSGKWIRSHRVPLGSIGPCEDEEKFHEDLSRHASPFEPNNPDLFSQHLATAKKIRSILHDIVFTHGDLWAHNILIHNGHVSAIIDWETAGWYPEYWEFTTIQRFQRDDSAWARFARGLSDGKYQKELECDRALWLVTGGSFPL